MRVKKSLKKVVSSMLAIGMVASMMGDASAAPKSAKSPQITVDYNTNIGTGSKYIFGGSGIPSSDEASAWSLMNSKMGVKLVKIPVDLSKLYPNKDGQVDTNVKEEYLHVASGQFTRARGAGMDIMLEFVNLPSWLDSNNDKKYDDETKYVSMIKEFLNDAIEYKDIIKFVEISPDESLSSSDFVEVYYTTAKAIRSLGSNYTIGGPGYTLSGVNDINLGKIQDLVTKYNSESDKSLLQFISLRAYNVDVNNYASDYFGELKEGRKKIRKWSNNADIPLFMTGWTTVSKGANTPDNNVTGNSGIKQQANALFKAMRDGWDMVLFNSTTSSKNSPASYSYTVDGDNVTLNPFTKSWNLLSNKLGLGSGEFKVVSTDMGSNWIVDDSIAMINSKNESIILASNFGNEKTDVNIELKNVPYEDGKVELECYVAKEGISTDTAYAKVSANVVNGMINATIPSIPAGGATGVIVKGGTNKKLPAQTIYEFESQDNHFGGDTEITWQSGASFNRVVKNFGGANNFVTLNKIAADGAGKYTAKLYTGSKNSSIKVSVNGEDPISVNGSSATISNSVDFDIDLKAGNENNIKVYTESGELRPDKLVLVAKDVKLSIGFQNLNTLPSTGEGSSKKYILPLARKDFKVDGRIFPDNVSSSYNLEYTSNNEKVVTVNNQGLLTPLAVGEAEITANIVGNTDINNTFKIVVENAVSGISVTPKTTTLKQNQTAKISAKVLPEDAENKNITWKTSNPDLVRIENSNNNEANIKVIGESGSAIIIAIAEDGGYEATCSITVTKPELSGTINIDYSSTIANGSPGIFGVTHYPSLNKEDNDIGDHSKVWEMLRDDMGVKFMRADARLQEILPIWTKTPNTNWASNSDIQPGQPNYVEADYYYVTGPDGEKRQFSVEGYRDDMDHFAETGQYLNGMSNPENWNTERLMNWVKKADEMDFEVMVMTFQIPEWLASGYPLPGAPHTEKACNSAPKDWEIFRDIIQKVYKMVKPYADYYEFLNEPHWYVPKGGEQRRPDGTLYPNSNKVNLIASDTMYQAIDAIYELEGKKPSMKLGGGADDSWGGDYGVLGTLFSSEYSKEWQERVEFVSIHKYGERPANQSTSNEGANSRNFKYWLRQKTGKDLPIFLNEYNASTGQPHEYHTGAKSMSYHGRLMIDMMLDGYDGGGYYTCYPSDVPMDDYEASSGWIERGKGVYAWNNGNPTLATFTKTWNLLSKKLELGNGDFKVKSTDVSGSKISDGIGAINANGKPVAFLTNYSSNEYGNVVINMNNVPYQKGEKVTAKVYSMTTDSTINIEPIVKEVTVTEDGLVVVEVDSIGSNGVAGVILEGNAIDMDDKTIEFESYLNKFSGLAKIENNNSASNGRWVTSISGGKANSVDISIDSKVSVEYTTSLQYNSSQDVELSYTINAGEVNKVILPKTSGLGNIEIKLPLLEGANTIRFYNESGTNVILDKIDVQEYEEPVDKSNLETLVKSIEEKLSELNQDDYINSTWINLVKTLEKAKEVLSDDNVSQEVVNDTYEELTKSYSDLSITPNKGVKKDLQKLIDKSEKLKEDKYTEESWIVLKAELEKAKEALNNDDITDDEVVKIVESLKNAMDNLDKINKK
ncbi:Ig-like domain-containing protein [Romboutsia weinsteinii]|uniref:Ig-like domain-containing protein n=1 Tax=Romboutsia weinsteinii TaxID=2020949 RepID=UPI001314F11C|nr:Ig-like domain-containing protein [Romboutsia weinsteinii]